MKYLIVNGDDFGATRGINRGIFEAHLHGILTSTSLLVNGRASDDAARLVRDAPRLSVGLHIDLVADDGPRELERQLARFEDLMGCAPSHLDSHHNVHHESRLRRCFLDFARAHGLALRAYSSIRCVASFYGRWAGESHPEHVSARALVRLLETTIENGITELSCHPGHVDSDLTSSYRGEREIEVRSLCDPIVCDAIGAHSIRLINHRQAACLVVPS